MVTNVPTAPDVGEMLEMFGVATTVNATPALATLDTVTTTFPVVAPEGTGTTMLVALQHVPQTVAAVPLNLTVLVLWVEPKLVPVIVTESPTSPDVGERLEIAGGCMTVNALPLLSTPLACATTLPVVAPDGTVATMLVALQHVPHTVAVVPLNLTVLVPCVEPKFVPVIVTDAPIPPLVMERLVIAGADTTVNDLPLLSTPLA
jgi:hypothetical protein